LQINRSCKSGIEGENYFLRMAYGEGLREEEGNWRLMSCEMFEMESDVLVQEFAFCTRKSLGP
jgi:hypothetical protein